jgi:peroxisomal membrane protein 4
MTVLFSNKPYVSRCPADSRWPAKIRNIFDATKTHALNLAKFVTIYKLVLLVQKRINGKERDLDSLFAGGLGGWWVFGERTAVS